MTKKNISESYRSFLSSFHSNKNIKCDNISEEMFFHMCKMKYEGWKHKVNFKRHKKHSYSEIFQDVVAYYLKICLPKNYRVELEYSAPNKILVNGKKK